MPSMFPFPFLSSLVSKAPEMMAVLVSQTQIPPISRLLPYSMDGPFKQSMNFFMRLAWSSKIQLPVLIAVCFMAFDIRLQLEINIFWEANHRQNVEDNNDGRGGGYILEGLAEGEPDLLDDGNEMDSDSDFNSSEDGEDEDIESITGRLSSPRSVRYIDNSGESDNSSSDPLTPSTDTCTKKLKH